MSSTKTVVIEGRNMVNDAIASDKRIVGVKIANQVRNDERIKKIEQAARKKNIRIDLVDNESLTRESESGNPQGVMAVMEIDEDKTLETVLKNKRDIFILLLNRIDYEQNLGAIMRSAWAAGVDAVVASPNGVHEITSTVAKVSMGGAAYVPLFGMSLFRAIDLLNKYAVKIIGVEVGMGDVYTDVKLTGPTAFLIGGEAAGLSEPMIKKCDGFVNIPMVSGVASLNVSVATALVLFEKVRQEKR